MSTSGVDAAARACSACARPISPPSAVTAALLLMFCGLNGRTRRPRRAEAGTAPRPGATCRRWSRCPGSSAPWPCPRSWPAVRARASTRRMLFGVRMPGRSNTPQCAAPARLAAPPTAPHRFVDRHRRLEKQGRAELDAAGSSLGGVDRRIVVAGGGRHGELSPQVDQQIEGVGDGRDREIERRRHGLVEYYCHDQAIGDPDAAGVDAGALLLALIGRGLASAASGQFTAGAAPGARR